MKSNNKNNNRSENNSLKKQIFNRTPQISSSINSSTQRVAEPIVTKTSTKSILESIYDDEFVIMINQLSTSIKNYYRANNKNFNTMKTLLKNNDITDISDNNELVLETFNKIENSFSFFYSSAKQIFKNMKIYRREKISNILAHTKKKPHNNRNNNEAFLIIIRLIMILIILI